MLEQQHGQEHLVAGPDGNGFLAGAVAVDGGAFGHERVHLAGSAFVANGGIGGDAHRVVQDGPAEVAVSPVEQRTRRGEASGRFHAEMHRPALEALEGRNAGKAGHLDVAEAMVSEAQLVAILGPILQHVRLLCVTKGAALAI